MEKNKNIKLAVAVFAVLILLGIVINAIIDIKINNIQKNALEKNKIDIANTDNTDNNILETEKKYENISSEELQKLPAEEKEKVVNDIVSDQVNLKNITGASSTVVDLETFVNREVKKDDIDKDNKKTEVIVSNGIILGAPTGIDPTKPLE